MMNNCPEFRELLNYFRSLMPKNTSLKQLENRVKFVTEAFNLVIQECIDENVLDTDLCVEVITDD